jgi:hypothetical protein
VQQSLPSASEDEVRATFERFVAAQNAHDDKSLATLLAQPEIGRTLQAHGRGSWLTGGEVGFY